MKRRKSLACSAIALTFGVTSFAAYAQEESFFSRDRYTAVTDRAQPAFDPVTVQTGAIESRPALEVSAGTRSNLFLSDPDGVNPATDEVSDVFLTIAPSLQSETTWSRHQVGLNANVKHTEYLDTGSESATDLGARLYGRLDVSSSLNFTGSLSIDRLNEARSSAAAFTGAAEPVEFDTTAAAVGANYEAGRLKLNVNARFSQADFSDVAIGANQSADQDFRDNDEVSLRGRVSYAVERDWAIFAEVEHIQADYSDDTSSDVVSSPEQTLNRDRTGQAFRVGTDFELSSLVRGDIGVGYQTYDFDDAQLDTVDGVSVDAQAQWFVSGLTTITARAQSSIVDPGIGQSVAATQTGAQLGVDHELARNILLRASVDYSNFEFESIERTDDRIGLDLGATWKVNRNVHFDAGYAYLTQDSDVQSFDDHRIGIGLRIYP